MAKIQPSEELFQAVRDHGTSILGTWSERRAAEERMLALLVKESGGSAWKEARLKQHGLRHRAERAKRGVDASARGEEAVMIADTAQDSLLIATRAVNTLDTLIGRSKRALANGSEHALARREGYLQSIALLMGVEVKVVRRALASGEL